MKRHENRTTRNVRWIVLCALAAAGCGDSGGPRVENLTPEVAERIAGPLSFMAFAVADGNQGASFLDNFMPSVRRGVIHYVNTPDGRAVTFNGCDLGGGIVLDGGGELIWVGPGLAPTRDLFCTSSSCLPAFQWRGPLTVILDGTRTVAVGDFDVFDIETVLENGANPKPIAATVSMAGDDIPVADETLYEELFDTGGMNIESIPNPANSLSALTPDDLRRLAYHAGMYLAWLLIGEAAEVRPDHLHENDCGTIAVTFDGEGFPHMASTWSECPERGIFFTGEFLMELNPVETDFNVPAIEANFTGDLTIGGGIPTIQLSAWEWRAHFPDGFPGEMEISITLEGSSPDDRRTFTETVLVDD